jgi:hypothetical protein
MIPNIKNLSSFIGKIILCVFFFAFAGTASASLNMNAPQNFGTLSQDLVGHWTFDGANLKNNVTDSSNSGNTGYLTGFGATSTAVVQGALGQGLKFDGVNDYVDVPYLGTVQSSGVYSISIWFNAKVNSGSLSEMSDSSSNRNSIVFEGGRLKLATYNGTTAFGQTIPTALNTVNKWHHAVFVNNNTNTAVYYDNVLVTSNPVANNGAMSASVSQIGYGASSAYFPGSLDDIRIYSRALSASEIKQLYNLGR